MIPKALRPKEFWARRILILAPMARSPASCAKYVREEKALSLEDAIRKFSALPAQRMRLTDRGVLKAGMWADVVDFRSRDRARSRHVRQSQPACPKEWNTSW